MAKRGHTLLIAEDEPGHYDLIVKNLHRLGFRCQIVHLRDGQEVLDYLYAISKDSQADEHYEQDYLILLDIRMPKVDGVEVLRQIKRHDRWKQMPVIMLTSSDDPVEMEACRELGCYEYIVKDLNEEGFSRTMLRTAHHMLGSIVDNSRLGLYDFPI